MDTSLVMVDGATKYGILTTCDANGNAVSQVEIPVDRLLDPLKPGQDCAGFALRIGQACVIEATGELQISASSQMDAVGLTQYPMIKLHPEEWSFANGVISIIDDSFNAIPELAAFKA